MAGLREGGNEPSGSLKASQPVSLWSRQIAPDNFDDLEVRKACGRLHCVIGADISNVSAVSGWERKGKLYLESVDKSYSPALDAKFNFSKTDLSFTSNMPSLMRQLGQEIMG
ncbi:hypothetical protein ANN_02705 [Periplaneta americana]|uniref:Per a allergen n=1 Tax=Periplaneta americana TaxID=6978 RepID=A0ABQ8TX12_PERAM|nr:hypothetical protein ANN_02705 [Periplaneta americana]